MGFHDRIIPMGNPPKSPSYCLTDKVKRRLLWNLFPHVFLLSLIALQAPECMWFVFYHGLNGLDGFMSCLKAKQKPEKPLGEDGGRCPCCYASALVL